jgi:serine phosphatase RsbU (regulator of sigma subunit)
MVRLHDGDRLLLYTDGVSEVLADTSECAKARIETITGDESLDGAQVLDAILAAVDGELAGVLQPDDLTLLTARFNKGS